MTVSSARQVAERFAAAAVDPTSPELWDLYGPSVVMEMPFAPPGVPRRNLTSRAELAARFSAAGPARFEEAHDVVIHDTSDPEVVILECGLRGRIETTGETFDLPFIMVMTVRDGHIVHSRDYSDPIVGARITGTLPRLVDALTAAPD
jgi:uncharacterized protein